MGATDIRLEGMTVLFAVAAGISTFFKLILYHFKNKRQARLSRHDGQPENYGIYWQANALVTMDRCCKEGEVYQQIVRRQNISNEYGCHYQKQENAVASSCFVNSNVLKN